MFNISIYFCFIAFISHINNSISHHREKRFLIFPRGNPTRHQFIAGVGTPLDLEQEAFTIGYVFKAQYFLPYNTTQLYPTRLERSINEEVDEYSDKTKVNGVPSFDTDMDDSLRWSIYHALENFLRQKMKIDGQQCILRAICEVSKLSFAHESGLMGELLHIMFIPSTTASTESIKNDLMYAEEIGKSEENCENVFNQCTFSLLNLFSAFY